MNRLLALLALFLLGAESSTAADVQIDVSSDQAYVDFPITLQIQIDNASKHQKPTIDPVDGLEIESLGRSNQSSRVVIINGRARSTSSIAYQWSITPNREGTFTIPPVKVSADGLTSITKAIRLTVTKADAGDLVFAEIERNLDEVYAGQPLELTLKVFVKAYEDEENGIRIGASSLWAMLAKQSQWGVFEDSLENLRMNRMQPRGVPVIRKDADGKDAKYYLFQIDASYYPSRPGPVDVDDDVKIVMQYPLAIERSRAEDQLRSRLGSMFADDFPFGGSLLEDAFFGGRRQANVITKQMPIAIRPDMETVVAKPIPNDGQPDDFTGAVGRYVIETQVDRTSAQAGDPIELTIRVRGTGLMETIVAPPLSELPELTARFRVSKQSLAGQVTGDTKTFVTTIRPLDRSVTEIPEIPFSYFDPDAAEYETSYSDPIAIDVSPADVLELAAAKTSEDKIKSTVETENASTGFATTGDFSWQPISASSTSDQAWLITATAGFVIPPFVFLACCLARAATGFRRRTASESKTIASIRAAKDAPSMLDAVNEFLGKKWSVPQDPDSKPSTIDPILGRLRSDGHHRYAVGIQQWSDRVIKHSPADSKELESLRESAIAIVMDAKTQRTLPTKISLAIVVFASTIVATDVPVYADPTETAKASSVVLIAKQAYADGDFATAAAALQTHLNHHAGDPNLYVNLANSQKQLGNTAAAKANYLSALQWDVTHAVAKRNLISLETASSPFVGLLNLPALPLLFLAIVGWGTLWITLTLRIWTAAFPWKSIAAAGFVVAALASALLGMQVHAFYRPQHAVVTVDQVQVRRGDGDSFETVQTMASAKGRVVRWIKQRPGWVQIEISPDVQGWVPSESLELIRCRWSATTLPRD
jgi:hypothetical protein